MLVGMGTKTNTEAFQIPLEAAEAYEEKFVPALFAEWAPHLIAASDLSAGQSVLDVACGTGIVARTAADQLGPGSRIVGVDLNEAMLTVARRVRPELEWIQGDAGDLPVEDRSFDVVLCQFALMFFPDRGQAMAEMARAATVGGVVAISVPADLAAQSAYKRIVEVVNHHAGAEATRAVRHLLVVWGPRIPDGPVRRRRPHDRDHADVRHHGALPLDRCRSRNRAGQHTPRRAGLGRGRREDPRRRVRRAAALCGRVGRRRRPTHRARSRRQASSGVAARDRASGDHG